MKSIFLLIYGLIISCCCYTQDSLVVASPDSLPAKKMIRRVIPKPVHVKVEADTVIPVKIAQKPPDFRRSVSRHPYFNFFGKPLNIFAEVKKSEGNETMFYVLLGLLLYFSLIRLVFGKYLNNLLTLFFRVTMRQQQLRDQLLGAPLPSMLLNFLFGLNAGLYFAFIAEYYHFLPQLNFWIKAGYGILLVSGIYFVKFIVLKLTGWIFNARGATDTYVFVVFLVNKMIGIFLIPLLALMAFANPMLFSLLLILSFIMLGCFFTYRFIIAFRPIRSEIKVNRFHFFLYLCAFEIAPLLLIYKVLLTFVKISN